MNISRLVILVLLTFSGAALWAQIPPRMNYQGFLNDPSTGDPTTGEQSMTFAIYATPAGGTALWSETQVVTVNEGYFSTELGRVNPIAPNLFFTSSELYLGVKVAPDGEMRPRKPINSVAYSQTAGFSVLAENAAKLGGKDATEYLSGEVTGNSQEAILSVTNDGNGSAGYFLNHDNTTASPALEALTFGGTGSAGRFRTTTNSNADPAIFAEHIGAGPALSALNSGTGRGIEAYSKDNHSIYVPDAGAAGLHVADAGSHGVDIAHANGNGVQVYSAGSMGIRVVSAGNDGIRVDNANWSGVYVANAASDALRVQAAGQDGLRIFEGVGRDYIYAGSNADPDFRVSNNGTAYADGGWQGAADFAELIDTEPLSSSYEPGDVLAISAEKDRTVTLCTEAYSSTVIGVYSTRPGFVGSTHPMSDVTNAEIPVAITGIVPCKVTDENGRIERGDLLTTSSTPGYAMKATQVRTGTILGKAMQRQESGRGKIEILVILQ